LVKAYLKKRGLPTTEPQFKTYVASRLTPGGNDRFVLERLPSELHACRQRNKRSKTVFLVVIDADSSPVEERYRELNDRLEGAKLGPLVDSAGEVILIPKRHVETWLCCTQGTTVTEEEDCKKKASSLADSFRQAANTIYDWSRSNATPGEACVPSLVASFPEWRKL
jgi:hypothetical protein